ALPISSCCRANPSSRSRRSRLLPDATSLQAPRSSRNPHLLQPLSYPHSIARRHRSHSSTPHRAPAALSASSHPCHPCRSQCECQTSSKSPLDTALHECSSLDLLPSHASCRLHPSA